MKRMKKLVALFVTTLMVLTMGSFAFADTSVDVSKHTFDAYQIFSGSQATDGGALGNVGWGTGVDKDALLIALKADTTIGSDFASCTTAAQVAEKVATYDSNSDKAKAFARVADANKTEVKTDITKAEDGTYTINEKGYYLIVDTTDVAGKDDAKNLSLLAVSNTADVQSKTSVPTLEKKVKDANDTEGTTSDWQDSADYDIGDTIPFQLTATMGDITNYKTYYVSFEDTMTNLTYVDKSVNVMVGTADKTSEFTTTFENGKLVVTCADVKALGATTGTQIVVTYNATLDEDANIGAEGNPNTAKLVYSNNPNQTGDGEPETGNTPEDINIIFTYKVTADKIEKVDGKDKALEGAGFTLYKKIGNKYEIIGDEVKGEAMTSFAWKGIDDGQYMLKETTTPAGYNTIADQYFTVTAAHSNGDTPALTDLSGDPATGSVITFTADKTAGSLATTVENKKGSVLPTTGGMGTTLFYIFGSILVLGAGVLLFTRKRMAR